MSSKRFVVAAGALLAGLGVGAGAGEAVPEGGYTRPQPTEPPGALRVVTYYPETTTSTSTCIDERRTPLCGVEASFASWVRSRDESRDPVYRPMERLAFLRSYVKEYTIIETRVLDEGDVRPWVSSRYTWAPGDVGILLWERTCNAKLCWAWNPAPMVHVMRKNTNGLWHEETRFLVDSIFERFDDGRADQRIVEPDEPPGPLRIVTTDDEVGTSDCMGRPVTPVCAVETAMAGGLNREGSDRYAYDYYNYKVEEIVRLDETNAPARLRTPGRLSAEREYTRVVVRRQLCGIWGCEYWSSRGALITRRSRQQPDRWEVYSVYWEEPPG